MEMRKTTDRIGDIESLKVPLELKAEVRSYCRVLERIYGDQICSIIVIGSAATPDFSAARSDINLMVVFREIEIKELSRVVMPPRKWWRRSRLSPRFISRRNIESAAKCFPIDVWLMKENHVTVYGEEILSSLAIDKSVLAWHVNHEVKGVRMRLKQQYVRSRGAWGMAQRNLSADFTTLLCLCRALLWLKDARVIGGMNAVMTRAEQVLCINGEYMAQLREVREGRRTVTAANADDLFAGLLDVVRQLDTIAEEVA